MALSFLEQIWHTESKDYVYGMLQPSQVPRSAPCVPLRQDAHYVEVILKRMRIVNVRVGVKKFYGAVQSDMGLLYDSEKVVSFKQVIAPPELKDVSAASLDRVIITDQTLLGPTPYRGGPLKVNVALLSVKSVDLAGPYLDVLTNLAGAAGVSFISAAQPFLKPLGDAMDLLAGGGQHAAREVQVVTDLRAPVTGTFVVLRAPSDEVVLSDIRLEPDYRLTHANGKDLSKYPYLVLGIEASAERSDWKGIPEIKEAFDRVMTAVKGDKPTEVTDALMIFRRTAMMNADLLSDHALALAGQVKDKVEKIMAKTTKTSLRKRDVDLSLDDLNPFA